MTAFLDRAGTFVRGLNSGRRYLFAWFAGLLSALGFAPIGFFPFLLLGYAALVLLIDGAQGAVRPIRTSALVGLAFGFGQFLAGLHWIGYAFTVDPGAHEWQIPFVAVLFPGGLALFIALACATAAYFWRDGPARIFAFTASLAAAEWLRGHILTGFPWNIAAYGWGASLGVLQSAALFGAYTLTLLTILFGASLAELFRTRPKWLFPSSMAALFVLLWIGGEVRLAVVPTVYVPGVRLRLVQPDIPQAEKDEPRHFQRNWDRLLSLSTKPGNPAPTIIVWPEAAAGSYFRLWRDRDGNLAAFVPVAEGPYLLLERDPLATEQIAALTARNRNLMTGALRVQRGDAGELHYYNSLFIFGAGGKVLATYDKFHLVPFAEYLPFERTLDRWGITKLTGISGSFARGDGPHTYDVPGAPSVGPLICYEILFPGAVVGAQKPGWFVNVTDDSWFGPWAGPQQHLLVARARAIEEGIPVVRAANTGISAIIDPLGRITAQLGLDRLGIVDGNLPAAIAFTPHSRMREGWFWLFLSACTGLGWVFSRRK
ncbi:MAG: apolipoprotein N-acyltransferase [Rhizomicrobium sp.]